MWIKVCGNTNLEDALFAAENGANALGFVFAQSPRRVTIEQVRDITPHLPENVETYGVFVDENFDTIVNAVLECGLTGVQLHALSGPKLPSRLRTYFAESINGGRLSILRAIHYSANLEAELQAAQAEPAIDGVLVDSRAAAAHGGTGKTYDWTAARSAFVANAPHLNLIAAGGLTPENVTEAIATLEPWGVDVVTGLEAAPGKKDPAKVREFIQRAQAAAKTPQAARP